MDYIGGQGAGDSKKGQGLVDFIMKLVVEGLYRRTGDWWTI